MGNENDIDKYWWYPCRDEFERGIRDRAEDGIVDDDAADAAAEYAWQLAQDTAAAMAGIICWLHGGHLPRVRGHWPEDNVCPRCGDLVTGLIEHAPEPGR